MPFAVLAPRRPVRKLLDTPSYAKHWLWIVLVYVAFNGITHKVLTLLHNVD